MPSGGHCLRVPTAIARSGLYGGARGVCGKGVLAGKIGEANPCKASISQITS